MELNFSRPSGLPSSCQCLWLFAWVLSLSLCLSLSLLVHGGCSAWMSGRPEMLGNQCLRSPTTIPCRNNLNKCLTGTDFFAQSSGITWGTCSMLASRIPYRIHLHLLTLAVCLVMHCLWLFPFFCLTFPSLTGIPWDQLSNKLFVLHPLPRSASGETQIKTNFWRFLRWRMMSSNWHF